MDEYHLIERIITLFKNDDEGKDWVKTLMDDIRVNYPSYGVALADLLYCKDHSTDEDWASRIRENFQMACTYGAEKPSFYTDIISYVHEFHVETFKSEFLDFLDPNVTLQQDGGDVPVYSSVRTRCYLMILKELTPQ